MNIPFANGDRVVVIGERLLESDQTGGTNSAWLRRLSDCCIAHAPEQQIDFVDRTAEAQTLHQVRQRWDDDVCWFKPDWVIVLLGLSDTWHTIRKGPDYMEPTAFHGALAELLAHHRGLLPESRIVLVGQPFLNPNRDPAWNTGQVLALLPDYQQAMRTVADDQGHIYVDAQAVIDEALEAEGANCLGADDQHPNQEGSIRLALAVLDALGAQQPAAPATLQANERIVFIGDSITDAGRRNAGVAPYGCGYMRLWRCLLAAREPELCRSLTIVNRGIGGNTIRNLQYRWQIDCLDHQPDHLVVKIGINDLNRWLSEGPDPVSPDDYEQIYDHLLSQVREQNPSCRITLLSAFYLCRDTNPASYRKRVMDALPLYSAKLASIAAKYDARLVDLQATFQHQLDYRSHVTFGGNNGMDVVHPSETGCMVIAEALYSAFN